MSTSRARSTNKTARRARITVGRILFALVIVGAWASCAYEAKMCDPFGPGEWHH